VRDRREMRGEGKDLEEKWMNKIVRELKKELHGEIEELRKEMKEIRKEIENIEEKLEKAMKKGGYQQPRTSKEKKTTKAF
jgi:predicted  nucleic acid-binding Zn-ribbon protein